MCKSTTQTNKATLKPMILTLLKIKEKILKDDWWKHTSYWWKGIGFEKDSSSQTMKARKSISSHNYNVSTRNSMYNENIFTNTWKSHPQWHTPVMPLLKRPKQGRVALSLRPSELHRELKASLKYMVRPCVKR